MDPLRSPPACASQCCTASDAGGAPSLVHLLLTMAPVTSKHRRLVTASPSCSKLPRDRAADVHRIVPMSLACVGELHHPAHQLAPAGPPTTRFIKAPARPEQDRPCCGQAARMTAQSSAVGCRVVASNASPLRFNHSQMSSQRALCKIQCSVLHVFCFSLSVAFGTSGFLSLGCEPAPREHCFLAWTLESLHSP
jgi:hypothetical protein